MPSYDTTYFKLPAPLARVTLRHPDSGTLVTDIPMLLDYGSDATLVPLASVQQLGVPIVALDTSYELRAFDGSTSFAPSANLHLLFLSRIFRGRYLLIDQEWGILGRDILNLLTLLMDGPQLTWSDQRPVMKKLG